MESLFICQEIESYKHSVVCQDNPGCVQASGYKIGISRSALSKQLDWDSFSSIKSLSFHLVSLLDRTSTKYHEGFVIIKCDLGQDQGEAVQVLMIPPRQERTDSTSRSLVNAVNVNLVLVEATSREMVFRDLPETVRLMRELNTASSSRTEVLDLTKVQDLTESNLAALMSGTASPSSPSLLSHFSASRHQIVWQTSDCPANTSNLITSLGVSRAFCHLEVPAEVATNLLLSAAALQDSVLASKHYSHLQVVALPWLTSSEDSALSQYLQSVSSRPNTVTVLTSLSSPHPALSLPLFIFVPHRVRSQLPDLSWRSLLTAQHQLTSLQDLHLTLASLASLSPEVSPSNTGLLSPLPPRHCSSLARPQFDCVCRPEARRLEETELRQGLGEVVTQLHNLHLSRDTNTVCARLRLARVLQADVNTYSRDNNFYRIILVLVLVADNQEENLETVIAGTVDLEVGSQTLRLDQWRLEVGDPQSREFGCLQQYSSQEENRLSVLKAVERERASHTSLLQNIFNENTVDCLWLLTKQFGAKVKLVELYSACLSEVEVVIHLKPGDDTLAWREGEQRTLIGSGETALINVCMVELEAGKNLDCQSTVKDIRYLDGGDDDDK